MPKEIIQDPSLYDVPDSTHVKQIPYAVQVGWGRESGDIQVATINTELDELAHDRGWFVDLDRNRLNQLIRVLRKARDQAFGRDE